MKFVKQDGVYIPVAVYLPENIHRAAIAHGVNMSACGRDAITEAVKKSEQEKRDNPELSTAPGCPAN